MPLSLDDLVSTSLSDAGPRPAPSITETVTAIEAEVDRKTAAKKSEKCKKICEAYEKAIETRQDGESALASSKHELDAATKQLSETYNELLKLEALINNPQVRLIAANEAAGRSVSLSSEFEGIIDSINREIQDISDLSVAVKNTSDDYQKAKSAASSAYFNLVSAGQRGGSLTQAQAIAAAAGAHAKEEKERAEKAKTDLRLTKNSKDRTVALAHQEIARLTAEAKVQFINDLAEQISLTRQRVKDYSDSHSKMLSAVQVKELQLNNMKLFEHDLGEDCGNCTDASNEINFTIIRPAPMIITNPEVTHGVELPENKQIPTVASHTKVCVPGTENLCKTGSGLILDCNAIQSVLVSKTKIPCTTSTPSKTTTVGN